MSIQETIRKKVQSDLQKIKESKKRIAVKEKELLDLKWNCWKKQGHKKNEEIRKIVEENYGEVGMVRNLETFRCVMQEQSADEITKRTFETYLNVKIKGKEGSLLESDSNGRI